MTPDAHEAVVVTSGSIMNDSEEDSEEAGGHDLRSQREILLESLGEKRWAPLASKSCDIVLSADGTSLSIAQLPSFTLLQDVPHTSIVFQAPLNLWTHHERFQRASRTPAARKRASPAPSER